MTKTIFFDFDGTLADSAAGIIGGLHVAAKAMGLPDLGDAVYRRFIGPVMTTSLHEYYPTLSAAEVQQTVLVFQDYYGREGWQHTTIYPGIPAALAQLQAAGYSLNVASAKPEVMLHKLLPHFQLDQYFSGVYGATLDESIRSSKTQVLAYGLTQSQADPAQSVMVGDRASDMVGGSANRVATLGVLYGFGDRAELTAAHADTIVATPKELMAGIQQLLG